MSEEPHLRISDQDRERAAAAIREHYAAGRLDGGEFEERLQATYAARTQGELDALSADLPALPPPPPSTREVIVAALSRGGLARRLAVGGGVFVAATVGWALSGDHHSFWPGGVLILMAIGAVRRRRRGAGPGYGGRGGGRAHSYRHEYRYGDTPHEHSGEHLD